MLVSEKILREWIETKFSADQLADTLTMGGIERGNYFGRQMVEENVLSAKYLMLKLTPMQIN